MYGISFDYKNYVFTQDKPVVVAHDVDRIELILWLSALCTKMDVPYCIVKGKARLGAFVYQKTAPCVAFADVQKGSDVSSLQQIVKQVCVGFCCFSVSYATDLSDLLNSLFI